MSTADRTAHVLATIEGALDDWETSPDAMRWRPPGAGPVMRRAPTFELNPEAVERCAAIFNEAFERMAAAFADVSAAFTRTAVELEPLGLLPEEPPRDPREHALWLRQHRNTGPDQPAVGRRRRPTKIEPL